MELTKEDLARMAQAYKKDTGPPEPAVDAVRLNAIQQSGITA